MIEEYKHLYRFNYQVNTEALHEEKKIMENSDTILHVVNTSLLEKVAKSRQVENIFPEYHDLQDKQLWDEIDTWTIRAFGTDKNYNEYEAFSKCNEMKRISDELTEIIGSSGGNNMTPYFMMQEKNTEVPVHIDMGFKCAINIIIDGVDTPIYFRDEDGTYTSYNYKAALLNVCEVFHGVPKQQNTNRLILKFRILDVDYNTALKRMIGYFG